jgi:RNA polymerase sigma-70 factor, ECF subfamily
MMPAAQAVESLMNEYGKLVFQTIYGLTGDWEESQDLTQDTFHQALKTIDAARLKSGTQFRAKAWLLQIALNTVRMQRRRRSIFRFIPFSRLQKDDTSDSENTSQQAGIDVLNERAAPVQPAGYGVIEDIDLEVFVAEQDAVQRSLARLPESLRLCLLLSIIGQLSTREIAHMLVLEEAAVRQRLGRARKQFQSFYELESGEQVIDKTEITNDTNMSQKRPPNHHSNIERAEVSFPSRP